MESFSLMLSGRTLQRESVTYLKARWPYCFVVESLGPGISRRDLDTDLRRREDRGGGGVFSLTDRYVAEIILWQIRF